LIPIFLLSTLVALQIRYLRDIRDYLWTGRADVVWGGESSSGRLCASALAALGVGRVAFH